MIVFQKLLNVLFIISLFATTACSQSPPGTTAQENNDLKVSTVADGLDHPWGMAFLPSGEILVTERSGQLRILSQSNELSQPLSGVPEVFNRGQGGLLDVALHPQFEENSLVYLSFSEPGENNTASSAFGRGKLSGKGIENFEVLFSQKPKVKGPNHFGGRMVLTDNHLYFTMGERFTFDPAQDLSNHLGTIVRLNLDGSIPENNPFINDPQALNEIYSYGHRNIESADIDPATGKLWVAEFGPRGGDELNHPEAAKNYGWPVVSWGNNYDGSEIPNPPTHPEFAESKIHWTPVISPSGMQFYTGQMFPEWKGKMLIGGLSSQALIIVDVEGEDAREESRIDMGARIRDVQQAPDGSVYLLVDSGNGEILRLSKK